MEKPPEIKTTTYHQVGNTERATIKVTTGFGYYENPDEVHDSAFNHGLDAVPESIINEHEKKNEETF